ncbi:MAG: alpha/beta hydrolase [Rhizobiales bacterium]|nr:alpha/beta hydrolase [Hyphomicrobiales bacterium]
MQSKPDLYRIRDYVADFERFVAEFRDRSARTILTLKSRRNVAYGPGHGEHLDLYLPEGAGPDLPIHMFIHGGYWRAFSKEDYAFVADTIVGAGAIAAIVDYSLMPRARMSVLVEQVQRACQWLAEHATEFGGDRNRLTVSGHSAGGHLAAMAALPGAGDYRIRSALLVSGLYELAPLAASYLQPELHLTPEEVERFSPLRFPGNSATRFILAVGADETKPFHDQAEDYLRHLRREACDAELVSLAGEHHMSIVLSLGTPGTECARLLERVIADNNG